MTYDAYNQQPQQHNPYGAYDEQYKTYNEPKFPHQGASKITVETIVFTPTGSYNQQWRRPWTTDYNVQNAAAIHDVVAQAYHQHQVAKEAGKIHNETQYMVNPADLAPVSASFIKPAASAEVQAYANMKMGWNEPTGRFMMVISVQRTQAVVPNRYVIIGYTDHAGFSQSGAIDPQMELNINTMYEIRDIEIDRGYGTMVEQQLVSVNQVLVDHGYQGPDEADTIRLRPYEVAVSLARLNDPELQGSTVHVVDTRSTQNSTPQFSNQHHTNPNDYMANVISGLVNGRDLSRQTNRNGVTEPYHAAARQLRDASFSTDPFIMAISRNGPGHFTASFKWRDMLNIDPNAERDQVCFVQWRDRLQFIGSVGENMHTAGTTSDWNGQDLATQVAVQISNMLPPLMTDLTVRKIDIFASNLKGLPICVATGGVPVVAGINLAPQMQALGVQFEQQVVMPMTFNGGIAYEMDVRADLFGEISITLRLQGQPAYTYVQPAYCSSVMSPVLTSRRDTLDNLAVAFHNLQQEVLPATPVRPLIHDLQGYQAMPSGKRY
jgi:hypothetical protein